MDWDTIKEIILPTIIFTLLLIALLASVDYSQSKASSQPVEIVQAYQDKQVTVYQINNHADHYSYVAIPTPRQ